MHWRGWELLGQDRVARLGASVEPTRASNATSWFGPLGLALSVVALALVVRAVRRRSLTPVALVLVIAPAVLVVGTSIAIGYHIGNGRYLMAGVALSAATWGIVRPFRAASAAVVAVAATTLALSFVHYEEKPAGLRLLEPARHESVWGLAPEWAQNVQPELVPITREIRSRAVPGETIALTRDPIVRPFVYVGWPRLDYASRMRTPSPRRRRRAPTWAVLPDDVAASPAGASSSGRRRGPSTVICPVPAADRGTVPRMPPRSSILMPVFNELDDRRGARSTTRSRPSSPSTARSS